MFSQAVSYTRSHSRPDRDKPAPTALSRTAHSQGRALCPPGATEAGVIAGMGPLQSDAEPPGMGLDTNGNP